jgi:hypothetical protein
MLKSDSVTMNACFSAECSAINAARATRCLNVERRRNRRAEPDGVDEARVVQGVGEDHVVFFRQRRQDGEVGG